MATPVFTLEALEAKHGDSLLLHYGSLEAPRLIVIDGGPRGVYQGSLRPRLHEIRTNRGGGQLEIRMLMVSHIDDDHIAGVVEFAGELRKDHESGKQLAFDVLTLWHNSFDDIIARMGAAAAEVSRARFSSPATADAAAIVASVKQGRQLRLDADVLAINMNSGFDDLIQFDGTATPLKIGGDLQFTVLGPRRAELEALEDKWRKELPALIKKSGSQEAAAAEFLDTSVHNLSSVVVLARFGAVAPKTMLLTGDARGDFILESLAEAKLLTGGRIDVDVLKMPHHGSRRNISKAFFETDAGPALRRVGQRPRRQPRPAHLHRSVRGPAVGCLRHLADERRGARRHDHQPGQAGRRHAAPAGTPRRPGPRRAGVRHSVVKTAVRRRPVGRLAGLAARRGDAGHGDAERAAPRA